MTDVYLGGLYQCGKEKYKCIRAGEHPVMERVDSDYSFSRDLCYMICPENWEEVKPGQWVVLLWADKHKNSLDLPTRIFSSENEALSAWKGSPYFIKAVRIDQ